MFTNVKTALLARDSQRECHHGNSGHPAPFDEHAGGETNVLEHKGLGLGLRPLALGSGFSALGSRL